MNGAQSNENMNGKLKSNFKNEALLAKKILILRQKYKQQKKEEKILARKNKKLVTEFQSHKQTLKGLNDERLALQKELYDKKYAKAISEGNNIALKNSLSSILNDLHALQAKVINSWKGNQRGRNRHSPKKPAESCPQESLEEQSLSEEETGRQSRASSQLDTNIQDDVVVCKVEPLNGQEKKPILDDFCSLSENKQELSLLLGSFCKRDTVPLDKTSGPNQMESENVLLERTCESVCQESSNLPPVKACKRDSQDFEIAFPEGTSEPDYQQSHNVSLDRISESDYQESTNVSLVKTGEPCLKNVDNLSLVQTCEQDQLEASKTILIKPSCKESPNVSIEITCEPCIEESANTLLEKSDKTGPHQPINETERMCLTEEPFHGFLEDQNEKAKFTDMIARLSVKCETLESLRNYEIAQSLTVFESNPEITEKEAVTNSTFEEDLSKYYKIQQLEVSIPRLDLSAYPSLNGTIEIVKKDVSRGRKSMKNNRSKEENQRDSTPDSASESSSNGRPLRRARNLVSYKEKSLIRKLRRS